MQKILDAKGSLTKDSKNSGRRFSDKGKHSKKRGSKQTKIICTKERVENDKSLVLHTPAIQHKSQQLAEKLLLKGHISCADASATIHTTGTKILAMEIICDAILV